MGLGWFVVREIRGVKEDNRTNYHMIDKKIHGVEIMVGPYAQDIHELKETQTGNKVTLTELRSKVSQIENDQERLQRQLEAIQNKTR